MHLSALIVSGLALVPTLAFAGKHKYDDDCAHVGISPAWYDHIVTRYLDFWNTNDEKVALDIAQELFSPDFATFSDRLPGANDSVVFPIYGIKDQMAFWNLARAGFEPYRVINQYHFGYDDKILMRFGVDAILKEPAKAFPGTSATPGSRVAYNGTDVFFINRCSGQIDRLDAAQDFITFFDALGFGPLFV